MYVRERERKGGDENRREDGKALEEKETEDTARSKLFAVPPCRKCSTSARSL